MRRWPWLSVLVLSGACAYASIQVSAGSAPSAAARSSAVAAAAAPYEALDCFRRDITGVQCPRLAPVQPCKGKRCLEPSGLVYDATHKIWVGVSDNYDDLITEGPAAARNVIFWFTEKADAQGVIGVRPLLSTEQAESYPLYDLEGITRDADGTYFATGSWSLGDSPFRFRMLRFRVVADERGGFALSAPAWVQSGAKADLRSWLVEDSGLHWTSEQVAGRPEKGGLNLEGLAVAPGSQPQSRSLLLGLRGPERVVESGSELWLLRATMMETQQLHCDGLSRALVRGGPSPFGLRALEGIEQVPGAYLYLIAPSGPDYNPTYAGVALPGQEAIDLGSLVQITNGVGVVPEGIAAESVRELGEGRVEVTYATVDDVGCYFQKGKLEFQRPRSAAMPFHVQPCGPTP